jgi:OmpA-OmpF porin, OOP family
MSQPSTQWEFPVNNMKKMALAIALACSAGTALAQEINPSWYIQPTVVWMKTDPSFGIDDKTWGGGLRFGKPISPYWDIQIGATQARADNSRGDYWQTLYGVDALLMLSRKNFRPFLLFGVGGEHDHVSTPLRHVGETSFYYQGGVGFQVGLNDRWTLQADVRAVRGHTDEDKFGFDKALTKYATVSLNYAFNPPPAPPAPAPVIEQPAPTPAPTEAPPPPPPPPPARFEKVTLSATELFAFDSAKLSMPQPKLDEIANVLQQNTGMTDITVSGYTDRIGSSKYNHKLSQRRANAVRDYLMSKGVDGSRLKAVGRGEENPVVQCNQKKRKELIACLAPNRRVEVEQITIEKRVE